MARSTLYWISPRGKIFKDNNTTHIRQVVANPKVFGVTRDWIEDIFKKHNEPVGVEGDAREEILMHLFKKGYIRVRLYVNKFWSITLYGFDRKAKKSLSSWADEAKKDKIAGKFMEVKILDLKSDKMIDDYDVNEISHNGHMFESEKLTDQEFLPEFITDINNLSMISYGRIKNFKDIL